VPVLFVIDLTDKDLVSLLSDFDFKELREDCLNIVSPIRISPYLRSVSRQLNLVDIGGRDDLVKSDIFSRGINPSIPPIPFYDPLRVYEKVESTSVAFSSGQYKLYLLFSMIAAAVGEKFNLFYVGGSPGDHLSFENVQYACSNITVLDPREPRFNNDGLPINYINSLATPENILELNPYNGGINVAIFDIRRDRGEMDLDTWHTEKLQNTKDQIAMSNKLLSIGYKLCSIKFWIPETSVTLSFNSPLLIIPYSGSYSAEIRTFQTITCKDRTTFKGSNLYNYASYMNSIYYKRDIIYFDYSKMFSNFNILRADGSSFEGILPRFVFELPRSICGLKSSEECDRECSAFFVSGYLSSIPDSCLLFSTLRYYDHETNLGFDGTQEYSEIKHPVQDKRYVCCDFLYFVRFITRNLDVHPPDFTLMNSETDRLSMYIRRDLVYSHKNHIHQSHRFTQTYLVRYLSSRLNVALSNRQTSMHALREECILSRFDVVGSFGNAVYNGGLIQPSGHFIYMMAASSIGLCDISLYCKQFITAVFSFYEDVQLPSFDDEDTLFEDRTYSKLWHGRYDIEIAIMVYKKLNRYGIPTIPFVIDTVERMVAFISFRYEAFDSAFATI
jgi:hypothetical protein